MNNRQAKHSNRKARKKRYNKHGIWIQTDRPPRRQVFPGDKVRGDE